MAKKIEFDIEARDGIKRGVDALANAVKVTLGPKGRNVIIGKSFGAPQVTKDGVTVAKEIELNDNLENMGAQMVKEVASKTNDLAGDGTTTATILAQSIVTEGLKNVAAGANPMDLKRGIDKAVSSVVKGLAKQSVEIGSASEKILQVASISANNDETIGKLITEAFEKVGKEGVITVEEAKGTETYVDVVEGMQFDRGYLSPYFVTNAEKMTTELENPLVLLVEKKLTNLQPMVPLLESVVQAGRPLLIIAEEVEGQALAAMIMNAVRGSMKVAAVKAPGYGQERRGTLKDICVSTGANFFTRESAKKMKDVTLSDFGQAKKIEVLKNQTTIVGGHGDPDEVDKVIEALKQEIKQTCLQ